MLSKLMTVSVALTSAAILGGCGGTGSEADAPADRSPTPGIGPAATPGGADSRGGQNAAGSVRVEVSAGPEAGVHELGGEVICAFVNGTWIASFSEYGELETQAVLESLTRDGGTTDRVQYTVVFGDPMAEDEPGTMLMLATGGARELSGRVEIDGGTGTVHVEGTTPDNNRITARLGCSTVQR